MCGQRRRSKIAREAKAPGGCVGAWDAQYEGGHGTTFQRVSVRRHGGGATVWGGTPATEVEDAWCHNRVGFAVGELFARGAEGARTTSENKVRKKEHANTIEIEDTEQEDLGLRMTRECASLCGGSCHQGNNFGGCTASSCFRQPVDATDQRHRQQCGPEIFVKVT